MTDNHNPDNISGRQILIASAVALVVAAILLVTVVLPAEFNRDPLGTGKLLGILGMAESGPALGALNAQQGDYATDTYTITLAPFESVEYKYRLEENASMLFAWQADAELLFDMHAEIDGVDPMENSPSFDQRQSKQEKGSYTAPFSGIHGWYWENRNSTEVTLQLKTVGFYSKAIEFQRNHENVKTFE